MCSAYVTRQARESVKTYFSSDSNAVPVSCEVMTQQPNGLGNSGGHHQPHFNMPPHSPFGPYFAAHFPGASFSTPVMSPSTVTSTTSPSSGGSSSGNSSGMASVSPPEELSKAEKMTRSHQYKKIMKPLLERKRRARINKCLDELKDIMTAALQAQGENVSKLEKADILELTVRHLHKMQQARRLLTTSRNPLEEIHRFQAGYSSCAQEAASFLLSTPGVDITVGQRLLAHLSTNMANPLASALQSSSSPSSSRLTPVHQPLPAAVPLTSTPTASSSAKRNNNETPMRRSSASPNLSPSKRLFHSPPLTSSATSAAHSPPPQRPSSTPANNNYSVTVSITSHQTTSDEDDEESPKIIKPSPIRLHPNDPVWRPF